MTVYIFRLSVIPKYKIWRYSDMDTQARIAQYIVDNGIKQSFISDKSGINKVRLSTILTGKSRMYADEFVKICVVLNKTPNDFMLAEE